MTNYEKMKAMSVEEMADKFEMREFFAAGLGGEYTSFHKPALEWLESEAEEDMLPEICSCGYRFETDETICPNCGKKVEDDERTFEE